MGAEQQRCTRLLAIGCSTPSDARSRVANAKLIGQKSDSGVKGPAVQRVLMMQNDLLSSFITQPERLTALDGYRILDTAPEERFDDIVRLATRMCVVPVALVSLVAADRQWFKARVGFPQCETDLDRSICKFALAEPDLLIIPDLTRDFRTVANPLVTGEPAIRFYAGAPLRMTDGSVLGSLCVIDTVPRPSGLTPEQSEDLRALGRLVCRLLDLRRFEAINSRSVF